VHVCIYRDEYSYVYKYLRLYCVSKNCLYCVSNKKKTAYALWHLFLMQEGAGRLIRHGYKCLLDTAEKGQARIKVIASVSNPILLYCQMLYLDTYCST
jgi:hypothetical protein